MRGPRIRVGIRGLMVAVAIAAGMLGWRQHRIYEALRLDYESEAEMYGQTEELARINGNITHEEWLKRCREVDQMNEEIQADTFLARRYLIFRPDPPELELRKAEYWGRMKARYERAARRPWLPVEPNEGCPR